MFEHFFLNIYHFFQSLGILGVFLSMFIENIGVPLPTEIGYLLGQNLVANGTYSYFIVLSVLTLGHVSGALLSYRIGLMGDNVVTRKLKRNKKINEVHQRLEKWYYKYGNFTVLITRFVGYVRPWSSFVAGFAGFKFWPFLLYTFIGSLIFNIINLYFSNIFILIWRKYIGLHFVIVIIFGLTFSALILWALYKYLFRQKNKK